jgi:hypothetical protein
MAALIVVLYHCLPANVTAKRQTAPARLTFVAARRPYPASCGLNGVVNTPRGIISG